MCRLTISDIRSPGLKQALENGDFGQAYNIIIELMRYGQVTVVCNTHRNECSTDTGDIICDSYGNKNTWMFQTIAENWIEKKRKNLSGY